MRSSATQLGLRGAGNLSLRGAGAGKVESQLVALPVVDLGSAQFTFETAEPAPLTALSRHEGRAVEGVVGYELLGHDVAEFDYAAPAVRLHDRASFRPPADAVALPFHLRDTNPIVELAFELGLDRRGHRGEAAIDRGAPGRPQRRDPAQRRADQEP